MLSGLKIIPFDKTIERTTFDCGSPPLNLYLKTQVSQDIKRRIASCFLAVDGKGQVLGYYTLASMSIPLNNLSESIRKKLPRYPSVPAVLLGRLAVDKQVKGKRLGQALLGNALKRVISSEIAAYALFVEAKDEQAIYFYRKFGFIPLINETHKLFFPLTKVMGNL